MCADKLKIVDNNGLETLKRIDNNVCDIYFHSINLANFITTHLASLNNNTRLHTIGLSQVERISKENLNALLLIPALKHLQLFNTVMNGDTMQTVMSHLHKLESFYLWNSEAKEDKLLKEDYLNVINALDCNCNLKNLKIVSPKLDNNCIKALAERLNSIGLETLQISSEKIDEEGLKPLFEAIKINKTLKSLDISGCKPGEQLVQKFKNELPSVELIGFGSSISPLEGAVKRAVTGYTRWYRNERGLFDFFFHGDTGQARAKSLLQAVKHANSDEARTKLINEFLLHSKTGYRKHSFATRLLDELKNVETHKNWNGIEKHGNTYNREDVLHTLQVQSHSLNFN